MKISEIENNFLRTVMFKMCEVVGADPAKINLKKKEWFNKHKWSEIEEEEFKKWFVNYLWNSKDARDNILTSSLKNKKLIKKAVDDFVFQYGWSYEK